MKKITLLIVSFLTTCVFAQNITFTFENARNTNDGMDDYYEADIYIASDTDFTAGSGQIYFNYNTVAFGDNVHTNGNFEMTAPDGSILASSILGIIDAYTSFIVNDNTTSRVSTSFQQLASSGSIGSDNVTSTPTHLYSIKFKYADINEEPNVSFENGGVFLDQFFTACGPTATGGFNAADCTNEAGSQITGDTFDSTGAVIITSAIWTGVTDTDWNTTTNWDIDALPEITYDITVPNVVNTPVIGSGTTVQMDDLTIETAASFDINDSGAAFVDGNFVSSGTVTMTSSASESSSLIVTGTASGTVTYERAGLIANEWSVVSAPVVGQSIKDFVENVDNNIRVNTTVTPNRYAIAFYDDSQADGSKWVYYTVDDLAANTVFFEKGASYAMSRATDGSVSFTGALETTSVTKSVIASQWNAVGNPFTAFLPINENSGDNFIADNAVSMDDSYVAVYVWDGAQSKYVANSLVDDESSLAPGQGFFVRTKSTGTSLTLEQDQRISQPTSGGVFGKATNTTPSFELLASSEGTTVHTSIKYYDAATLGLDPGYDIGNFSGASFDVYTHLSDLSSDVDFTIQSLPTNTYSNVSIPLGIKAAAGKEITLSVDVSNFTNDVTIYLEDKITNTFTNLSETSYKVTLTEASNSADRFLLHTNAKTLSNASVSELADVTIYKSAKKDVTISGLKDNATVTVYSISGVAVFNTEAKASVANTFSLANVASGVYIVKLQTENAEKSQKLIIE